MTKLASDLRFPILLTLLLCTVSCGKENESRNILKSKEQVEAPASITTPPSAPPPSTVAPAPGPQVPQVKVQAFSYQDRPVQIQWSSDVGIIQSFKIQVCSRTPGGPCYAFLNTVCSQESQCLVYDGDTTDLQLDYQLKISQQDGQNTYTYVNPSYDDVGGDQAYLKIQPYTASITGNWVEFRP